MSFAFFRKLTGVAEDDTSAKEIRYLIDDNTKMLARARTMHAEVVERLSHPGDYLTGDDHERDELERDRLRREIEAFEDRLARLPAELAEAEKREANAARDARLAKAPEIAKRANKRLAAIDKAAKAHADLLAEQAADEREYNALVVEARAPGRALPGVYADKDIPEIVEPERTVTETRWGKVARISGQWAEAGGVFDGAGRPLDHGMTKRPVTRTIPAQVVQKARYFESPTGTTQIAGYWPKR